MVPYGCKIQSVVGLGSKQTLHFTVYCIELHLAAVGEVAFDADMKNVHHQIPTFINNIIISYQRPTEQ